MFLFLFARTKKRSDEIAKFQFLIPANGGVATFSLQKVPESAGDSGFSLLILLCYLAWSLNENKIWQPSHTLKRVELLWSSLGKVLVHCTLHWTNAGYA